MGWRSTWRVWVLKMKDKRFLQGIHDRLEKVHGEKREMDYMHKLRAIINAYPKDKETPNVGG